MPAFQHPAKNYGGVDMVHFFALLLTNQVIILLVKNRVENLNTVLGKDAQKIESEKDEIINQLKKDHKFFYPGKGNVYDDYKIMRNADLDGKEALPNWIHEKEFSLATSSHEIYQACLEKVKAWWPSKS